MKIQQISIFLENKPGRLNAICRTLADNDINIATLSIADTQQFGIVRLIIKEWPKAQQALEKAGYVVNVREVVATAIPDRAGGIAQILDIVTKAGVNIEYLYALPARRSNAAIAIIRFDNPDAAIQALANAKHDMLSPVDIFNE